jgi:hypothetical protein
VPAHAISHHEQVTLVAAVLHPSGRQARTLNMQRLAQYSNQELVLVGVPNLTGVGQTETAHH